MPNPSVEPARLRAAINASINQLDMCSRSSSAELRPDTARSFDSTSTLVAVPVDLNDDSILPGGMVPSNSSSNCSSSVGFVTPRISFCTGTDSPGGTALMASSPSTPKHEVAFSVGSDSPRMMTPSISHLDDSSLSGIMTPSASSCADGGRLSSMTPRRGSNVSNGTNDFIFTSAANDLMSGVVPVPDSINHIKSRYMRCKTSVDWESAWNERSGSSPNDNGLDIDRIWEAGMKSAVAKGFMSAKEANDWATKSRHR